MTMIPTINFLVDHVGASHMAFHLVGQTNSMSKNGEANITVFYDQLQRPCRRLLVPSMLMIEAWAQKGVAISTSLSTAARMLSFPGPTQKIFYVWDMSWIRNPKRVGYATEIFRNPNLTLMTRCVEHAQAISNNFNVEVPYIVENFDKEILLKAIEDDRKTKL